MILFYKVISTLVDILNPPNVLAILYYIIIT